MELPRELAKMDAQQLRDLTASLLEQLQQRDNQVTEQQAELSRREQELKRKELKIEQLTHEMAILKRWQYARRSEQLDAVQYSLLEESIDADLAAIELEIEALCGKPAAVPKSQPRRVALPAHLPRREIHHEPEQTQCSCGCDLERFGEDISEKLDYTPGVFEVERHIRGKWVCRRCERLIQAPVPPHVIDKGIPTASLLSDETPVPMLNPTSIAPTELTSGATAAVSTMCCPRSFMTSPKGAADSTPETSWEVGRETRLRRLLRLQSLV